MKQNTVKYILIVIVIIVWGVIFYKVIGTIFGNKSTNISSSQQSYKADIKPNSDTFSIYANYIDPFLKRNSIIKSSVKQQQKVVVSKRDVKVQTSRASSIVWPNIVYSGVVSSFQGNKSTVMILINGISNVLKKGSVVNEVEIVSITRDSIKLKYKDEYRYIKKNETR